MCCGLAILAFLGPRAAIIFWWLFRPLYFSTNFSTILWPILGIIFVPWLTLMYLIVAPGGINGLDWLWLGLGLFLDISSYSGSFYGNKNKLHG
ncbi:MAG: hypothetical protein PHU86_01360 [Patescibacteria group bacterium]|jgi:hypothetical protein|nr:hypothetical protein [Patescibacteria group bacterium]